MKSRQLSVQFIIITLFAFVFLWALMTDAWGFSELLFPTMSGDWSKYLYGYISRIIWVLPALGLLSYYGNNGTYYDLKNLYTKLKLNRSFVLVILITTVYCFSLMLIVHRGFWLNPGVSIIGVTIKFIIVGFVEETVFRGWGYNTLRQRISDRDAMIVSSILFVFLHWPAYFIKFALFGTFNFWGLINQSILVFLLGMLFCYLFKKSSTLLNPIISHAFYDLFFTLFVI